MRAINNRTFLDELFIKESKAVIGGSVENMATVTFNVDGTDYVIDEGATWADWISDHGPSFKYAIGESGEIVDTMKNKLRNASLIVVHDRDEIVSGTYLSKTSTITFSVPDKLNDDETDLAYSTYEVAEGTTWRKAIEDGVLNYSLVDLGEYINGEPDGDYGVNSHYGLVTKGISDFVLADDPIESMTYRTE